MEVGIDTSVLVGFLNPEDLWHKQAVAIRDRLRQNGATLIFFDCVVGEAVSTLTRRLREKKRADEISAILDQFEIEVAYDLITWLLPKTRVFYPQALELIRSSSGELNFNDALIALFCRERGITYLASFDSDFDQIPWLKRVATPADLVLNNGREQ